MKYTNGLKIIIRDTVPGPKIRNMLPVYNLAHALLCLGMLYRLCTKHGAALKIILVHNLKHVA